MGHGWEGDGGEVAEHWDRLRGILWLVKRFCWGCVNAVLGEGGGRGFMLSVGSEEWGGCL